MGEVSLTMQAWVDQKLRLAYGKRKKLKTFTGGGSSELLPMPDDLSFVNAFDNGPPCPSYIARPGAIATLPP